MDVLTAHGSFADLIERKADFPDWECALPENSAWADWELHGPAILTAAAEIAVGLDACHDPSDLLEAVEHFVSVADLIPKGALADKAQEVIETVTRWGDTVGSVN